MVIALAENKEAITRRDVMEHLRVSNNQAYNLLKKMKDAGVLTAVVAKGRGARYRLVSRK